MSVESQVRSMRLMGYPEDHIEAWVARASAPGGSESLRRTCSECGRSLDGLMAADASRPGFFALLCGEGDWLMRLIARSGALVALFGLAVLAFWALSLAL